MMTKNRPFYDTVIFDEEIGWLKTEKSRLVYTGFYFIYQIKKAIAFNNGFKKTLFTGR